MSGALAHIVDDDEAIRDALAWLFETRGVACRGWPSGEAFLDEWKPEWRGCIVLDIRMGGMSGLACFDALRQKGCQPDHLPDRPWRRTDGRVGDQERRLRLRRKPFNDNDLVDIVRTPSKRTHVASLSRQPVKTCCSSLPSSPPGNAR